MHNQLADQLEAKDDDNLYWNNLAKKEIHNIKNMMEA